MGKLGHSIERIGLEAGPLSQWLHAGLTKGGFETVLLETRHVKATLGQHAQRIPEQFRTATAQAISALRDQGSPVAHYLARLISRGQVRVEDSVLRPGRLGEYRFELDPEKLHILYTLFAKGQRVGTTTTRLAGTLIHEWRHLIQHLQQGVSLATYAKFKVSFELEARWAQSAIGQVVSTKISDIIGHIIALRQTSNG